MVSQLSVDASQYQQGLCISIALRVTDITPGDRNLRTGRQPSTGTSPRLAIDGDCKKVRYLRSVSSKKRKELAYISHVSMP
jgi:hypothetical protein